MAKDLRTLILSTGKTKTCATRRANEARRTSKVLEKALIWGIQVFGHYAPTRVTEIDQTKPFKSVAHYAYTHGYKPL